MRKLYLVALALAMSVLFTVATTAYAEDLLWLVNGLDFEGTLSAETEGELTLTRLDKENGVQQGAILCLSIFDGTITNPATGKGTDTITELLDINQKKIAVDSSTSLSEEPLSCEVTEDKGDLTFCSLEVGGVKQIALLWPSNLPWKTELVLMTATEWLDVLGVGSTAGNEPGYEVECITLIGIKASDLCEGATSAFVLAELGSWPGTAALGSHGEITVASEGLLCVTAGGGTLVAAGAGLGITWAIEGNLNRLETDVSETP